MSNGESEKSFTHSSNSKLCILIYKIGVDLTKGN